MTIDFHPPFSTLKEARRSFEQEYILAVMIERHWRVGQAAIVLGMNRPNLYRKLKELGIVRPPGSHP